MPRSTILLSVDGGVQAAERAYLSGVISSPSREEVMKIATVVLAVALALANDAAAEQPDRSRLIGTPIYSSDGAEVGTIRDVHLDETGGLRAASTQGRVSGSEPENWKSLAALSPS
jgi:hypothetical protein